MSDLIIDKDSLHNFLTNTLKLNNDDFALLQADKISFLNKLIKEYDCHAPFHNFTHTSVVFEQRQIPSYEEILHDVFAGNGGNCWGLNYAMYVIIKTLGFNASPLAAYVASKEKMNHLMILVKDVEQKGDQYLIDVGFSNTAHEVIPLDFEEVSPIYKFGYQTLRWVKKDNFYIRQDQFDPKEPPYWRTCEGNWSNAIYFNLHSYTLDEIKAEIEINVFKNPTFMYNTSRRITGTNEKTRTFIAIKDKKLYKECNGKLEKETLENDDEVLDAVNRYFQNFPLDIV